LTSNLML